jgi:beta-lysine 5,6-aminomutase beta subunit
MSQKIKAYGDLWGDGLVQLSFTLPVPAGPRAREAARVFAEGLGLRRTQVAWMEACGERFAFFVVYGYSEQELDFDAIHVPVVETPHLDFDELNALIEKEIGRKVVVLGACIGSDAHTVGIDAIMNMKGYAGDYGLERYPGFDARNLGAQIEPEELCDAVAEAQPDAVLVSQVVTQRDIHTTNAKRFLDLCRERGLRDGRIFILGGPRFDHKTALDLGYDAGFGPGTRPSQVANYLVHKLLGKVR